MIDGIEVLKAFQPHRGDALVTHSGTTGSPDPPGM